MIYVWKCNDCGERVDIIRCVADRHIPPADAESAHGCPGTSFSKVITAPRRIFVPENEDPYWDDSNYRE